MKIKTIIGLTLAGVCLAACSVEEQDDSAAIVKENYTREFIKEFGTINPNQDWNVVEQKNVTINTTSPVDVIIYEKQDGKYKLAADYKAVSGSKTITFDGMEGDNTPFIVSLDGNMTFATNGETINYNGALASGIKRAAEANYYVMRNSEATTLTLSQNDGKFAKLKKEGADQSDSFLDMCIESSLTYALKAGELTNFYPIYHGSVKSYEFGMYYYDDEEGTNIYCPMYKTGEYADDFTELTGAKENGKGGNINSHAYTFYAKKDIMPRIYVKSGDNYYYTNPKLNDGKELFATATVSKGDDTGYTYITFDDPENQDNDFNDLIILRQERYTSLDPNPDTVSYLVACEDLGGTFDYDFNDLVFRVSHVSGSNELTITPLAAGGMLEAYLCYNGQVISDEWHSHFGDGHDVSDMINTGHGNPETNVKSIKVTGVPTDFSMTQFSTQTSGFSIKVAGKEDMTVAGPGKGEAPQMLILPNDWKWPKELTNILTAYPQFGEWGANYNKSTWVNTVTNGNYIDMGVNAFKATKTKTVELTK